MDVLERLRDVQGHEDEVEAHGEPEAVDCVGEEGAG